MGQSQLRRETCDAPATSYAPKNGDAYLIIYNAVKGQRGLIHGHLHSHGEHCAIGSYFYQHPRYSLDYRLIDEVAAVNDSVPYATPRQRRLVVMRWLRWKLAQGGRERFAMAYGAMR